MPASALGASLQVTVTPSVVRVGKTFTVVVSGDTGSAQTQMMLNVFDTGNATSCPSTVGQASALPGVVPVFTNHAVTGAGQLQKSGTAGHPLGAHNLCAYLGDGQPNNPQAATATASFTVVKKARHHRHHRRRHG